MSSDNSDNAIAAELRMMDIRNKVLRARMRALVSQVEKAMLISGISDMRMVYLPEIDMIIQAVMNNSKGSEVATETDLLRAAHLSLAVAWRVAVAADIAASILLDPASKIDPDEPLYI